MSCRANERHITFEEGCWTFQPNSVYHSVMLLCLQEEHVSCQCTFGSRLHEEREKVNSLCECSKGSFLTESQARLKVNPSFCRLMRGALKCKLRRVLVPRSKSQVISPDQASALIKLLPPPVVKGSQLREDCILALCRLVSAAVRSDDVAKGPAVCKARMSVSCPSSLASLSASGC